MNKSISIVLTVHNKELLIKDVIRNIFKYKSHLSRELVIIFDGCTDRSEEYAEDTIRLIRGDSRNKIIIDHAPDVFETKANNIGLKQCTGDYTILIQDDMLINEENFDSRLLKPILSFSDCFACSGRAAHNDVIKLKRRRKLKDYLSKQKEIIAYSDLAGRENNLGREIFAIRDVVNRGPLLIDNQRLQKLDFLDESFAPYVYDDHDLCFRAFKAHGWLCGSYIINYRSDINWGTTRLKNGHIFKSALAKNEQLLIARHRDLLDGPKHNENRVVI